MDILIDNSIPEYFYCSNKNHVKKKKLKNNCSFSLCKLFPLFYTIFFYIFELFFLYVLMVLMVRSFRSSTHNVFQWISFSLLILLSMFAIYCIECKSSYELAFYRQKRHVFDTAATTTAEGELLPTDLILVFTLDGSIRGMDRYDGRSYWTLQGGHKSSLIKADSQFKTHQMKLSEQQQDEGSIFNDIVPDIHSENDIELKHGDWQDNEEDDNKEEQDVYYIVEPQEGGNLYIYGDGRPLEVINSTTFLQKSFILFILETSFFN